MYSNSEYADMHLVYGAADGSALEARRRYSELFPRRQLPNHQTFLSVDRRMRQYGIRPGPHSGRPLVHAVHIEEHVLDLVHRDPAISTRQISAALKTSTIYCMAADSETTVASISPAKSTRFDTCRLSSPSAILPVVTTVSG